MKKPVNPEELENDMNKILSFINNLENLDIENMDDIDNLKKQSYGKISINKTIR